MEKNTKILIGVGLGIVAAYFVYSKSKNKLASKTSHQGSDNIMMSDSQTYPKIFSDDLAISQRPKSNSQIPQSPKITTSTTTTTLGQCFTYVNFIEGSNSVVDFLDCNGNWNYDYLVVPGDSICAIIVNNILGTLTKTISCR